MTHEYVIATGGVVLAGDRPTSVPAATAIAWAADRVLAVGPDDLVRALSRGDSTFLRLDGCAVTPVPSDPVQAEAVLRAAVSAGGTIPAVDILRGAGLLTVAATLEPGAPADLAFWTADPSTVPPHAAASLRIVAVVRDGAFTAGDVHTGPFARADR